MILSEGIVSGTIRGARTVRINPTGADTYEIVLEIDREMINYLLNTRTQGCLIFRVCSLTLDKNYKMFKLTLNTKFLSALLVFVKTSFC